MRRTKVGFIQLVEGDTQPCPHLHVDRRVVCDSVFDALTAGFSYRDIDHCHDCGADIEVPAVWFRFKPEGMEESGMIVGRIITEA